MHSSRTSEHVHRSIRAQTCQAHARWRKVKAYFAYFADHEYKSYCNNIKTGLPLGLPLGGGPVLRLHILFIFNIFNQFAYKMGGFILFIFFCIFFISVIFKRGGGSYWSYCHIGHIGHIGHIKWEGSSYC